MTLSSQATEAAVPVSIFAQAQEAQRIRMHLRRVERALRRQPGPQLSPEQRAARGRHLDALRYYWKQGRFPRNFDHPGQQIPCFIDRKGHVCAVAHLLIESGHAALASQVAATANNAYIAELRAPAFDDWVVGSGLTKDELARIQPSYPELDDLQHLSMDMARQTHTLFVVGAAGLLATVLNLRNQKREHVGWIGRTGQLMGIIAGAILLYLAPAFTHLRDRISSPLWQSMWPFLCGQQQTPICAQAPFTHANYLTSYTTISILIGIVALAGARHGLSSILNTIFVALRALRERVEGFLAGRPLLRRLMPLIIAVALVLLAFTPALIQQVDFARTRLPIYPHATTQSVQDGWALFSDSGEKRYIITLQTTDSPAEVQQFYERAILQKGWTLQAQPGHIFAYRHRNNPSGRDTNADTVKIDIWSVDGWTYILVKQFHGIVYFGSRQILR